MFLIINRKFAETIQQVYFANVGDSLAIQICDVDHQVISQALHDIDTRIPRPGVPTVDRCLADSERFRNISLLQFPQFRVIKKVIPECFPGVSFRFVSSRYYTQFVYNCEQKFAFSVDITLYALYINSR